MRHRSKTARIFLAGLLTLCLVAGSLPFAEEASAASDYNTQLASPFSHVEKSLYTHNARFTGSLILNGVDVSEWQHQNSNWIEAKARGVDFAIMRVSYTGTTSGSQYKDSYFASHYSRAKAAGVMKGVYVFSQAKTDREAVNEAIYAVNRLHALGIYPADLELPVYMDYEFSGPSSGSNKGRLYGISKAQAKSCAKIFCQVIRSYGYQPGVYANTSFFKNYLDNGAGLESDVDLWCAQYYSRCESGANYTKWQYSSAAYVGDKNKTNGILSASTGKVSNTDVNFWYLNKSPAAASLTNIYGVTDYNYTGGPVKPSFEIYDGGTLLREGVDYVIGGINNVNQGTTGIYAYIRGIGNYSGYALVPITIGAGYQAHIGLAKCYESGQLIFGAREKMVTKYLVRFVDGNQELSCAYYPAGTDAASVEVPADPAAAEDDENTYTFAGWTNAEGEPVTVSDVQTSGVTYYASYTAEPKQQAEPVETPEQTSGQSSEETSGQAPEQPAEEQPAEESQQAEEQQEAAPEVTLEPRAESIEDSEGPLYDFQIGMNSYGSYLRNVPAGMTVAQLREGLQFYTDNDSSRFEILDVTGNAQQADAVVRTGMQLAVYSGSLLLGTADITVNGEEINKTAANYLTRQSIYSSMPSLPTVTVKATSIKSLKKGKKSFTVKVKKLKKSQASGYQVRYSRSSDMSGSKTKTIGTKYNKVTKKITKLKKKKTYYVQVRTYKKVDGVKYYSSWSKMKKVKTK